MSTSFDLIFSWNSDGGLVLRSSVATINKSPVQLPSAFKAYPLNLRGKTLMRRTDALDLSSFADIVGTILLLLQKEWTALPMVNWTDVRKVCGYLQVCLAYLEDSPNTPLRLHTSFLAVHTEPILTRCLPSLVVLLVLQDLSWFKSSSSQAVNKFQTLVCINGS